MIKIKFITAKANYSFGEWEVELPQDQVDTVTESIDTETLIAELESRGYTVKDQ